MKWKAFLKELGLTLVIGAVLGGGLLFLDDSLTKSFLEPYQRPIFLIGVVLFSIVFRMILEGSGRRDG